MGEVAYISPDGRELTAAEVAKLDPKSKAEARINGARNQGIKEGRQRERAEMLTKLGIQRIEDASQIATLTKERDARPTEAEERKHGRHQRWLGFAIGVPAGMVLACAAIFLMQGVIWDTATRSFREQAMTGAIIRSQDAREEPASFTEHPRQP